MNYNKSLVAVGWVCLGLNALACSSGRDVEVSGKITAPSSVTVGDKLAVDFLDVVGEGDTVEKSVAHSMELQALGDFKETVALEGDKVIVRAIDDRDDDGKCSAGEAWGETEADIVENKVEAVTLTLGTAPCPAEE
ncbi:MAG TPA: hypothetical protein VJN18_29290 [Polyangiaceae bacterium]|nr:hypothetical protein [Polyangiaceae bacterium]